MDLEVLSVITLGLAFMAFGGMIVVAYEVGKIKKMLEDEHDKRRKTTIAKRPLWEIVVWDEGIGYLRTYRDMA